MPIYDCECVKCKNVNEQYLKVDEEPLLCETCNEKMVKVCNCSHFRLKYDPKKDTVSWGNEGYNSSMYWKDVKDARFRGEKVKGANEC